jgi:hypothetical protein
MYCELFAQWYQRLLVPWPLYVAKQVLRSQFSLPEEVSGIEAKVVELRLYRNRAAAMS